MEYNKAAYCHPVYLTYTQSTSCEMPGWMGYNGIKIAGKYQPQICGWYHSNDRKQKGTKEPLKLNIKNKNKQTKKTKIIGSSPITSWPTERENVGSVTGFLFLCSKITADGDCSHEIRRQFLVGRKAMTNLDSVLKSDITLPTKVCVLKTMVFPVVMYGCESWTIKKAEYWRIDALELWC